MGDMSQATSNNVQDVQDARITALVDSLLKKRDEAVAGRAASGVERRWREDQRAFEGVEGNGRTDMIDFATGEAFLERKDAAQPRRSKVIVNIIRGKCDTAEGRFSEIQLPTDDKNWGIQPSPVSEMATPAPGPRPGGQMLTGGAPAPMSPPMPPQTQAMPGQPGAQPAPASAPPAVPNAAFSTKDDAKKRASLMEEEIADQLEECRYNGECRKVIRSAVRLGTGVLKGPNVVKSVRRAWVEQTDGPDSVWVMKTVENMRPASTWRDVWNIYPDPHCGSDPKRGSYIYERDYLLPRELTALIGLPGYNTNQIIMVLKEEPKRTTVQIADKGTQQQVITTMISRGAPYERWEYNGDVDRDDLAAMGCTCPDNINFTFSACIVFVNDRPVKVQLNTLDSGELPYDFFQWVQLDNDSPWGIGEPRKLIWQQRIITAAWRAMMDNAGDSSGGMLVISKDAEPEDGVWEVTGRKIWIDNREDGDVRQAIAQFQITNNQVELERIIDLALKFIDMESGTPMIAQGEKGSAPETLGGMQLLVQGADTTRRHQTKQYDDQITRPHIGRYYDWNMQYSKKKEIKGDFEVDARGTSVLLIKDQMAQTLQMVLSLRADPEINLMVDWSKVIKQLFQALHLDVLKSDEEADAARQKQLQQPPPVAPQVLVAQLNAQARGAELDKKLAADAQAAQTQAQLAAQEADKDRQLEMMIAQIDAKLASDKLSSEERRDLERQKVLLTSVTLRLKVQQDLSLAGHTKDLHMHHNPVAPQVMTPPTEPAGRAQDGQAFTQ